MSSFFTNPEEFKRFHLLLTRSAPKGFLPFYFPLEKGDKEPLKNRSWKNNRKTFGQAYNLMKDGYNIGICATGKDCLCIVDIDDLEQVTEIKPTLQITSRKRIGLHNYFFAIDGTAKKNIATGDAGEVRANWQYVLAPGSFVECSEEEINRMPEHEKPHAGRYTVKNELPVSEITFEELPDVYKARYTEMVQDELGKVIQNIGKKKEKTHSRNIQNGSALWELTISDVSGIGDTGNRKIPMPSEIHGSQTGHNCSVRNGLMHCWRHYVAHNAFSYLAVLAGVSSCERAGYPHEGRYFGVDFQDGKTVFEVWHYAKRRGMIPENDPIPRKALVYYAISRGCCKKEEVLEGNRLPILGYTLALLVAKQEGVNLGRN